MHKRHQKASSKSYIQQLPTSRKPFTSFSLKVEQSWKCLYIFEILLISLKWQNGIGMIWLSLTKHILRHQFHPTPPGTPRNQLGHLEINNAHVQAISGTHRKKNKKQINTALQNWLPRVWYPYKIRSASIIAPDPPTKLETIYHSYPGFTGFLVFEPQCSQEFLGVPRDSQKSSKSDCENQLCYIRPCDLIQLKTPPSLLVQDLS